MVPSQPLEVPLVFSFIGITIAIGNVLQMPQLHTREELARSVASSDAVSKHGCERPRTVVGIGEAGEYVWSFPYDRPI